MSTSDTAHARHWGDGRCYRTWRQINDAFTICTRTGDSLRWALTDQQTIARTSNVFFARWRISNWLKIQIVSVVWLIIQKYTLTVASLHFPHLTTCCSRLLVMSIMSWHTRHVTIGTPDWVAWWYGGGNSSGPIDDTVACATPATKTNILFKRKKIRVCISDCASRLQSCAAS